MKRLSLLLFLFVFTACGQKQENESRPVSMEAFSSGAKLVKIPVTDPAQIDSLYSKGFEVIVAETAYAIVRMDNEAPQSVKAMSLKMQTVQETELAQRLIRVVMSELADLQKIANVGVDIWEVKGDTVIAQAYDIYIRQIKAAGFPVEIIERDVRNLTQKP